ncbi:MAG: class I tRNA ligase family protein, partial [Lentimonas sp.]
MAQELKDTLNLPQTNFPMRGNMVEREPARIDHWKKLGLYEQIQAKNADGPSFILHDGPPFTNGDLHLGHALNKTLKDTILRYKWMQGYNAPYIPGWDSHGLPIEHKVSRELQEEGRTDYTPLEVREACAKFANKYREIQTEQFKRLGVLADWQNEYWTIHPEYEATELETFASFVERGLVYRSKKPVYWSIPCATALAEAEIEYRDHKSISVFVKLPLSDAAREKLQLEDDASVLIWTTTPWTLPANMAVSVHPKIEYSAIKS